MIAKKNNRVISDNGLVLFIVTNKTEIMSFNMETPTSQQSGDNVKYSSFLIRLDLLAKTFDTVDHKILSKKNSKNCLCRLVCVPQGATIVFDLY